MKDPVDSKSCCRWPAERRVQMPKGWRCASGQVSSVAGGRPSRACRQVSIPSGEMFFSPANFIGGKFFAPGAAICSARNNELGRVVERALRAAPAAGPVRAKGVARFRSPSEFGADVGGPPPVFFFSVSPCAPSCPGFSSKKGSPGSVRLLFDVFAQCGPWLFSTVVKVVASFSRSHARVLHLG